MKRLQNLFIVAACFCALFGCKSITNTVKQEIGEWWKAEGKTKVKEEALALANWAKSEAIKYGEVKLAEKYEELEKKIQAMGLTLPEATAPLSEKIAFITDLLIANAEQAKRDKEQEEAEKGALSTTDLLIIGAILLAGGTKIGEKLLARRAAIKKGEGKNS